MKKIFIIISCYLILIPAACTAQQVPNFTQFAINPYLLDPAYAGTNEGFEAFVGRRQQWVGFEDAPQTNYASVTYGWHKNFSYRFKHGVGFYAEDDRQGLFASRAAYASYSCHLKLFTGVNVAAGLSVGARQMGVNNSLFDSQDQALAFQKSTFLLYPDVIPGMRFYTKNFSVDISARQLSQTRIEQGSKKLGSPPSRLDPTLIAVIKRRFLLGDNTWSLTPAVKIQSSDHTIPFVEGNIMLVYNRKIGVGASYRNNNFASAVLQVKIFKNIIAGFSYDYTLTKMKAAAANSFEMVLGFTPAGGDDRNLERRRVANCPDFDF